MALKGPSCLNVEQKRDFDLSIILDALGNAMVCAKSITNLVESCPHHSETPHPTLVGEHCAVQSESHAGMLRHPIFTPDKESMDTAKMNGFSSPQLRSTGRTIDGSNNTLSPSTSGGAEFTASAGVSSSLSAINESVPSHAGEMSASDLAPCKELKLDEYLRAFAELTRFFKLTGPVFTFVARDLAKKISILQTHRSSSSKEHYLTLRGMIEYEISSNIVSDKGAHASGTRTLLRLHWALEFFIEFMDKLRDATDDMKTSTLVYDVYQRTLANHHPWWTRKVAYLAVHTLPSIKALIGIMCKQDYEEVKVLLSNIVTVSQPILNYTTSLYNLHNISNIP